MVFRLSHDTFKAVTQTHSQHYRLCLSLHHCNCDQHRAQSSQLHSIGTSAAVSATQLEDWKILVTACRTNPSTQNHHAAQDLRCADQRPHLRRLGIRWPTFLPHESLRHASTPLHSQDGGLRQSLPRSWCLSDTHSRWLGLLSSRYQHHMRQPVQENCCCGVCWRPGRSRQIAVKHLLVERLASPR